LQRFKDIAGFVLMTSPPFHPNLGVFPFDQIAHVEVSASMNLKLISREIICKLFQPIWSRYVNVTDRRTDRHTDAQATYCGMTVLCVASRS